MKNNNKLLACPYIIWMVLFTIIPLGIVVYYALTDSITGQFTLSNLSGMGTYLPIFLRSIWLSLFASLICLLIGYPVAYFIAQCSPLTQRFLEMLIMLPMCMSFLLRTLAWVGMLEDTGIINTLLQHIGIRLNPEDIHIMHKSEYSGLYGDYSSYSAEYDEIADAQEEAEDEE